MSHLFRLEGQRRCNSEASQVQRIEERAVYGALVTTTTTMTLVSRSPSALSFMYTLLHLLLFLIPPEFSFCMRSTT